MRAPAKTREELRADLARAAQQVNQASRALEVAQQAMAEHDESDEGRAEDWLLAHNIEIELARDGEGTPLPGNYVISTQEILALANCVTDLPATTERTNR